MTAPTLAVIVPVCDERDLVSATLHSLRTAVDRSPWRGTPITVIDDGSTDGTGEVLSSLAPHLQLQVIHQPNAGRLLARTAGLRSSSAELALLVDARVRLDADALQHVAEQMAQDASAVIWNGDVTVLTRGNPYAGFWSALTAIGWHRWYRDRTRASYGLEAFDRYPKGTGLFLAPRAWLLEASLTSSSLYDEPRYRSDDTALIRALAGRSRIHLSAGFSCTYVSRDEPGQFARHAFFRGTTFIDSYLGQSGLVGTSLLAALGLSPVGLWLACRRPRLATAGLAGAAASAAIAARRCGAPWRDAGSLAVLSPAFGACFGAGIGRGVCLALRAAASRRSPR